MIISPLKLCPVHLLIYIHWIIWGWVAIIKLYLYTRPWLHFIMWPVFVQFDVNYLFLKVVQECKPKCSTCIDGCHTSTAMRLWLLSQSREKIPIDLTCSIHWLNTYLQSSHSGMHPGLYTKFNSDRLERANFVPPFPAQIVCTALDDLKSMRVFTSQKSTISKLGVIFLQLTDIYLLASH